MEQEKPRENVYLGTLGAFLGSLLGVAFIVLEFRLGHPPLLSGMVMMLCATTGYHLLGKRLGALNLVISSILVVAMTYFANHLCAAFEIMDAVENIDFFTAYEGIDAYREAKVIDGYWAQLFALYLFEAFGVIPVIIGARKKPAAPAKPKARPPLDDPPELQGAFYPMRKDWMRPLRLSVCIPVFAAYGIVILVWMAASALLDGPDAVLLAAGGFLAILILFCMALPTLMLCNTFNILYVRAGGKLWRVDLLRFCGTRDWEKELPDQQEAIRQDILQEIECLLDGETPSYISGALVELKNLRVEGENRWSWKISYETDAGRRKKLKIGKCYPGFAPDRHLEKPRGPAPCRWVFIPLSILLTAALTVPGCIMAQAPAAESGSVAESSETPEPTVKPVDIPARVPETFTEFEMSGVWFRIDSQFQYGRRRTFLDGGTGTFYRVNTQFGVDAHGAWDTLTQYIEKYHTSPLYDRFRGAYMDEDLLVPLAEGLRYNIMSVYLTDGRVFHTGAVLDDCNTLFTIEAWHDSGKESVDDVLSTLMYVLKSVRFPGLEITEENYQSQIHVAEVRDCTFMATAYIKTDIFGHDALVDVYVPYDEQPIYSGDGKAIRSEAHGLRAYVTILPGKNAKAVIDTQAQTLAASGRVYETGIEDEMYREDIDAACKLTVYEENGQKRYAVLYADEKWEGYYLFREFTGLPELVDEDYPAVLRELEQISGLTMPALEALGKSEP